MKPAVMLPIPPRAIVLGFIDVAEIKTAGESGSEPSVTAMGWAVSCRPRVPLMKVVTLIDDKPVAQTAVFFPRPDVSAAFGRPEFDLSGWQLTVPLREPLTRAHKLVFQAVNSDGAAIELPNHDGSRFSIIGK